MVVEEVVESMDERVVEWVEDSGGFKEVPPKGRVSWYGLVVDDVVTEKEAVLNEALDFEL